MEEKFNEENVDITDNLKNLFSRSDYPNVLIRLQKMVEYIHEYLKGESEWEKSNRGKEKK